MAWPIFMHDPGELSFGGQFLPKRSLVTNFVPGPVTSPRTPSFAQGIKSRCVCFPGDLHVPASDIL